MKHKKQNWSFEQPPLNDGDTAIECNCSQKFAHTAIGAGKTGLKFVECNLVNCDVPGDATLIECNNAQIDFCYWLNPEMGLPVEVENCRHVVDTDTITIDGESQTIYERENTVL